MNAVLCQSTRDEIVYVHVKKLSLDVPEAPFDLWNGSRFLFDRDLFPDKLQDFGGKVLRATSFNFPPYTYKNSDGSWGGWEFKASFQKTKLN